MSYEETPLKKLRAMGVVVTQARPSGNAVRIAGTQFRNDVLLIVAELKNVTTLDIEGSSITDAGLVIVKRLRALQVVRINDQQATARAMNHLSDLPDLRDVFICGRRIEFAEAQEVTITPTKPLSPSSATDSNNSQRSVQQTKPSDNEAIGCAGALMMLAFPPVLFIFFLLRSSKSESLDQDQSDNQLAFGIGLVNVVVVGGLFIANGGLSSFSQRPTTTPRLSPAGVQRLYRSQFYSEEERLEFEDRLEAQDELWRDAPVGRTRGGDTY